MKKIMFFVAAFIAVTFTACGGGNNTKSEEPTKKVQTVKDSLNKVATKAAEDAANKAAEGIESVKDAAKQAGKELEKAAKDKATEVSNAAVDAAKQAIDDAADAAKKQLGEKK